ncbi:hypothetical protein N9H63_01390 [bacterium]|nr:hypothetical protein [bacterium]
MNNKKVASLLNKGIKFETLKMLNETQIDTLYTAVIGEQKSLSDKVQDVQQLKGELSQLNQAIDQTIQKIGEEENEDGLEDLARQDYTGQEGPHDEKDMAPDGMDDDSDNNRSEMGEEEEVNPWAICTSSLGLEGRERDSYSKSESEKYERCVRDVKKQNEIRQIEESIVSLVKKYVPTTMSKKDLINLLEQGPGTKEAPVKTPTRTKPERKTPYKPKHKPAPKAGETETAPSRVKPGTIEKPERKTPYKPKHKPAPKAGKKELPSFLKFNTLNIQFRDEQED